MTGEPLRVLVVDDDYAVAALHRDFVEELDTFTVVGVAHSGEAGLAEARRLEPDLVLLDIYMPDITGLEVLRRLREELTVDVIVITAAREVETVRTAMAGGVLHYLVKPFRRADLWARLEDYLERRRLVAQAEAGPLDQEHVDRLLGAGRTGAGRGGARRDGHERPSDGVDVLPKGLAQRTMEMVVAALTGGPGPWSAEEIAERVGMPRVTARRYLEHLVATGRARVRPRFGRSGRPQHLYEAV